MSTTIPHEPALPHLQTHERYVDYPHNHHTHTFYHHATPYATFLHNRLSALLSDLLHTLRHAPRPAYVVTDSRAEYTHHTSVYNGTAGILHLLTRYHHALRHHRIHPTPQNRLPGLSSIAHHLSTTLHALEATLPTRHREDSLHRGGALFFGLPGILLTCATAYHTLASPEHLRPHIRHLLSLSSHIANSRSFNNLNEILFGRAGYLLSLATLHHTLPTSSATHAEIHTAASEAIASIIADGQRHARHPWPLLWYWHDKAYLGAAHGVGGILYALLIWYDHLTTPQRDAVMHTLNVLASFLTTPCPPSLDRRTGAPSERHELMHWCHGPPGHIMLFCLALRRVRRSDEAAARSYTDVIETLAERIVEKGLVRKGMGLCHGVSGNCYAFLSAYRATHNERYLHLARAFYHVAATSSRFHHAVATYHDPQRDVRGVPDTPFSLMEGTAGEACLLLDLLHPQESSFPGFEYNSS